MNYKIIEFINDCSAKLVVCLALSPWDIKRNTIDKCSFSKDILLGKQQGNVQQVLGMQHKTSNEDQNGSQIHKR